MDLDQQQLFARQSARLRELESWLALLVVRHGYETGHGFRYDISDAAAQTLRRQLPSLESVVVVSYEPELDLHVLDTL